MTPRLRGLGLAALAVLLLACRLPTPIASRDAGAPPGTVEAQVVRVVDGDTIIVRLDGRDVRVRYIGINTPESADPRREVQCFGKEAAARNEQLVGGKRVRLEKDVSETDQYGRLLRYVYVDGTMVNAVLVQEGYAYAITVPPDVRYAEELRRLEREAREARRGLWGTCPPRPRGN
jgi:micrococcal nuclease